MRRRPWRGKELMRLLDEVDEGVYFTDRQRRITFWNKAAERISGYSRKEVLGRRCSREHPDPRRRPGPVAVPGLCPLACTLRDRKARQTDIFLHHRTAIASRCGCASSRCWTKREREIGAVELFSDMLRKTRALESAAASGWRKWP